MQVITSKDNEIVKNIKKLKDKKYRDEAGLYVIEGIKIIEEAIEEKRFEFLFVYFAVAVLVLHDKVGKSEADNP